MAKTRRDQEKIQILQELEAGGSIAALCRKYGISRSTIHRWQKRLGATLASPSGGFDEGEMVPERAEEQESTMSYLRRLEAENVRLRRIVVQQALRIDALEDRTQRRRG